MWVAPGGFLYFDYKYDIVAINSIYLGGDSRATCAIYFGKCSILPEESGELLDRLGRWWPVTSERLKESGYCAFAWILPSEYLGSHIFTRGGGFSYKSRCNKPSIYFPVV